MEKFSAEWFEAQFVESDFDDEADDIANQQMAEAEGRWVDGGCAYISY